MRNNNYRSLYNKWPYLGYNIQLSITDSPLSSDSQKFYFTAHFYGKIKVKHSSETIEGVVYHNEVHSNLGA